MATAKGRGIRKSVNEKRQGKQASAPKHPPYEAIINDAFSAQEHALGFTRDAILKTLLSKHGIRDKKSVILKLNTALRNGLKTGTLKRIDGTGMSGTFKLTGTKTDQNPKVSKAQNYGRTRSQTSKVGTKPTEEGAQVSKTQAAYIKKSYDLRKRKSMAMNEDIKSKKAANIKASRGRVKKNIQKQ